MNKEELSLKEQLIKELKENYNKVGTSKNVTDIYLIDDGVETICQKYKISRDKLLSIIQ
jgi:hypothetical protein